MRAPVDVICGGILVADHVCTPIAAMPEAGHLALVDEMHLLVGGCASNVASNLARQGVSVGIVGRVGADVWGRFLQSELAARGVDCAELCEAEGYQTSQSMVLLCRGQDRRFIHNLGANRALRASDFDRERLAAARVFYLGGYLILPGIVPEEAADLFRFCRERGIRTVLDVVVPDAFGYGGELDPLLPYTDVFVPNDDEARLITGESDPERQVRDLAARGAGRVAGTLGSEGLLFMENARLYRATGYSVPVVDQTGAGDAFAAGLVTGLVRGLDLRGCLEYGSALGASCVRSLGCCDGVFDSSQARQFLEAHPLRISPV